MFSNWPQYTVKKGENLKLILFLLIETRKGPKSILKKEKL